MFLKQSNLDYIVVGLGNPGKKYEHTRHNVGFDAIDRVAEAWKIKINRAKFDALTGTGTVPGTGKKALLVKPQTFMNLSGQSVQKAAAFYKIPAQRVVVLFDDVSLAPGVLRLRANGSAGGHNGIKSIIDALGQEFPRVKIGVGERPSPQWDLADWVLSTPTQAEQKAITARYDDICAALALIMEEQFTAAQSKYNG